MTRPMTRGCNHSKAEIKENKQAMRRPWKIFTAAWRWSKTEGDDLAIQFKTVLAALKSKEQDEQVEPPKQILVELCAKSERLQSSKPLEEKADMKRRWSVCQTHSHSLCSSLKLPFQCGIYPNIQCNLLDCGWLLIWTKTLHAKTPGQVLWINECIISNDIRTYHTGDRV